jgi:hypothetical protein
MNGLWKCNRGVMYKVFGSCKHTETKEPLILYHILNDNREILAKPREIFLGTVDDTSTRRFRFVLAETEKNLRFP